MITTKTPENVNTKRDTNSLTLTGVRVNFLTVIRKTDMRYGSSVVWECVCDCGNTYLTTAHKIKAGVAKSCGCKAYDKRRSELLKHGASTLNSKLRYTYVAWLAMIQRCFYKKHKSYDVYGGAGITVVDAWRDFSNFLSDMGERPRNTTIGRINHNGNYEKCNCRWETPKQQANSKKTNRLIAYGSEIYTFSQLAEKAGLRQDTFTKRIDSGWSVEKAVTTPLKKLNRKNH